jgi:outer membrane protein TolC
MKILFFLIVSFHSLCLLAGEFSLKNILCHALANTPQFERVRADLQKAQGQLEIAQAPLSSRLEMSASYLQRNFRLQQLGNELEFWGNGAFVIPQIRMWETTEGSAFVSKGFLTGTTLRTGASYQNQLFNLGGFHNADINVGSLSLELSQDLWRNFFGSISRKTLDSANWEKRAAQIQMEIATQELLVQLQTQYISVWLEWTHLQTALENEQSNKDYHDIIKFMTQKGMSDDPSRMQSESSWISSRQGSLQSLTNLTKELGRLEQLSGFEMKIESLDQDIFALPEVRDWERFCYNQRNIEQALSIRLLKTRLEAAKLNQQVAKEIGDPRLSLGLSVANNTYHESRRGALSDLVGRSYGMHYGIGLNLAIPLEDFEQKGRELEASASSRRLEATLRESIREVKSMQLQLCTDMNLGIENQSLLEAKKSNDGKIAQALLKRWRAGRVPFNEVLRAQSDYYRTSRELAELRRGQRQKMWGLYQLWGEVWKIDGQCP